MSAYMHFRDGKVTGTSYSFGTLVAGFLLAASPIIALVLWYPLASIFVLAVLMVAAWVAVGVKVYRNAKL